MSTAAGYARKILSVAGITAPLNDLARIHKTADLTAPSIEAVVGFSDGYWRRRDQGACPYHEVFPTLHDMACCREYVRGYMIGRILAQTKPAWVVAVSKIDDMTPSIFEFWLHGNAALDSKREWEKCTHYVRFYPYSLTAPADAKK